MDEEAQREALAEERLVELGHWLSELVKSPLLPKNADRMVFQAHYDDGCVVMAELTKEVLNHGRG